MHKSNAPWLKGELRELGVFLGWIAGMFLIAGLAWFVTRPLRAGSAVRHINALLEGLGEARKLEAPLDRSRIFDKPASRRKTAKAAQLGTWYALADSDDQGVVFSVMDGGVLAPFLVFISPGGEAGQPVPLGAHSERVMNRLSPEILRTYIGRLEAAKR
jgi:hypothetical protein